MTEVAALSQESFMSKFQTSMSVDTAQHADASPPKSIVDAGIEVFVMDDESLKLIGGGSANGDPWNGIPNI
jgi:hypothetical protein